MVEADEQCDDGNQLRGDCCTPDCRLEQDGSVCDDGDPCNSAARLLLDLVFLVAFAGDRCVRSVRF